MNVSVGNESDIKILTQVTTDHGRPDMEIRMANSVVYVEAKVESQEGDSQLPRYAEALAVHAKKGLRTQLVYLTRYPEVVDATFGPSFYQVRWFQIANCFQSQLEAVQIQSSANSDCIFLITQFIDFLLNRGIAMQQIHSDLSNGVRSMRSLLLMISEAISGLGVAFKQSRAWDYIGFDCDSNRYWIGLYYNAPESLVFETNEMSIDVEKSASPEIGGMLKDHWTGKKKKWTDEFDLSHNNDEFYSLTTADQMKSIESFLRGSVSKLPLIEHQNEE